RSTIWLCLQRMTLIAEARGSMGMSRVLILTTIVISLSACAQDAQRQAAIIHFEQVGITPKDPQFDPCTYAYGLQAKEDALNNTYDRALNAGPPPDRLAHRGPSY